MFALKIGDGHGRNVRRGLRSLGERARPAEEHWVCKFFLQVLSVGAPAAAPRGRAAIKGERQRGAAFETAPLTHSGGRESVNAAPVAKGIRNALRESHGCRSSCSRSANGTVGAFVGGPAWSAGPAGRKPNPGAALAIRAARTRACSEPGQVLVAYNLLHG